MICAPRGNAWLPNLIAVCGLMWPFRISSVIHLIDRPNNIFHAHIRHLSCLALFSQSAEDARRVASSRPTGGFCNSILGINIIFPCLHNVSAYPFDPDTMTNIAVAYSSYCSESTSYNESCFGNPVNALGVWV